MVSPFGPGQTSAFDEVLLSAAGGTLRLPLWRGGDATTLPPKTGRTARTSGAWSGSWKSGEGLQNDVARRVQTFDRGAGYAHRPVYTDNAEEWNGYAESENVCTRFGAVVLSGQQTVSGLPADWGPIVKLIGYAGDLFVICDRRIAYVAGGVGLVTELYGMVGDVFTDAELWQRSLRVANICTHLGTGAGNHHSFVTITSPPGGGAYTVTHPDETGTGGAPHLLSLLATVFWEHEGVAGYRLVGRDTSETFKYMLVPNGDPYDPLNWSAPVTVGESTFPIDAMVASHDTLWAVKRDGVYAITDKNAAAGGENLTPYWKDQLDAPDAHRVAYYFEDRLIVARPQGIEAIDVQSWQVQDRPRRVDVAHGRPNDTPINGRYTALCSDSGWLVAALARFDGQAQILYAIPRPRESPSAGLTEYDWFPEIGPLNEREIRALCVFTPATTRRPTLWVGMAAPADQPGLMSVDLFRGSTPLSDPGHQYHTSGSITFTDEHWGTRRSNKSAAIASAAVRFCGDGRRVDFYAQSIHGNPFGATPFGSITTNIEAAHWSLHGVFPRANVVRSKAVLTRASDAPHFTPVLYEWEIKANLAHPLRRRGTMLVEVGTLTRGDLPEVYDPTTVEVLLVSFAEGAEIITMTDPEGEQSVIVLDNVVPYRYEERSDSNRRVRVYQLDWTQVS